MIEYASYLLRKKNPLYLKYLKKASDKGDLY